jgi:hypothetical protein
MSPPDLIAPRFFDPPRDGVAHLPKLLPSSTRTAGLQGRPRSGPRTPHDLAGRRAARQLVGTLQRALIRGSLRRERRCG